MRLSKKVVRLICLSSMMSGIALSSGSNIVDNSNLSSIKGVSEIRDTMGQDSNIEKYSEKNIKELEAKLKKEEQLKSKKLEEQRKSKITYSRSDITLTSGITKEELKSVLMRYEGASTMAHLSDALVDAEAKYGVNAFTMAAIVALESGFATSRRAVEDNNLTGYEVYSDDSEGRLFVNQDESVLHTARHLSKNYLTEGGMYYRGLSVDDVQVNYCPDEGKGKNWDEKVDKIASGFLEVYKELYMQ